MRVGMIAAPFAPVPPMGSTEAEAVQVVAAYAALTDVDVIHDHTMLETLVFGGRAPVPILTTCHGEFTPESRLLYRRIARSVPLIAISQSQRRSAPDLSFARVIYHGLDRSTFPVGSGDGGYLAFLGRMGRGKGLHRAIHIARAAGRPLRFAAKMREDGLAQAVAHLDEIDRAACREDVERRFGMERMVALYLEQYERLTHGRLVAPGQPDDLAASERR
jgi:hypothetical protein